MIINRDISLSLFGLYESNKSIFGRAALIVEGYVFFIILDEFMGELHFHGLMGDPFDLLREFHSEEGLSLEVVSDLYHLDFLLLVTVYQLISDLDSFDLALFNTLVASEALWPIFSYLHFFLFFLFWAGFWSSLLLLLFQSGYSLFLWVYAEKFSLFYMTRLWLKFEFGSELVYFVSVGWSSLGIAWRFVELINHLLHIEQIFGGFPCALRVRIAKPLDLILSLALISAKIPFCGLSLRYKIF